MSKIMPLDLLSGIKGATSSEAVEKLFDVIGRALPDEGEERPDRKPSGGTRLRETAGEGDTEPAGDALYGIPVEDLRSDTVRHSPEPEKEWIRKNFPEKKNGYLVVPKVIEE